MIRYGSDLPVDAFLGLTARVWPRDFDREAVAAALARTIDTSAWDGGAQPQVVALFAAIGATVSTTRGSSGP